MELDAMAKLVGLAAEAEKLNADLEQGETWMAQVKLRRDEIVEHLVPALMEELGLNDFTLKNGKSISINHQVFANISKERESAAFDWLRTNGHGDVIKEVTKTSVHPQTLRALMRELLESGADVPLDLFGVHHEKVAKIS